MNYLAHVLLAENDSQSIIGNLMADVLRRQDFDKFPPRIQHGIRQHRQVDSFTDRHPAVLRSIRRLAPAWGWFGGIIIDVYHDHLLSESWIKYSSETLRGFCNRMNDVLAEQMDDLPEEGQVLARRLIEHDRLYSYSRLDGIEFALTKISERLAERMPKLRIKLQDSLPELEKMHDLMMDDFTEFFPQLMEFSESWKGRMSYQVSGAA